MRKTTLESSPHSEIPCQSWKNFGMPTQLLADFTASSCTLLTVGICVYQRAAKVTMQQF